MSKSEGIDAKGYDLLYLHQQVLEKLEEKHRSIPSLSSKLEKYEWIKSNAEYDVDRIKAKQEIFRLNREIKLLKDKKQINQFVSKVEQIIVRYKEIQPKKRSFIFVKKNVSTENEKKTLYTKYLSIAQTFVTINVQKNPLSYMWCKKCETSNFGSEDDNMYHCKNCGMCIDLLHENHSYKDIDRINLSSRYTYTRKAHFKEAINKFQAKQNTSISKEVYDVIYAEIEKYKLPLEKITKDHIMLFLGENGHSSHYEDLNLIFFTVTKTDPPNISEYEDSLLTMFDKQDKVYEKIKDPSRINSLNVNYKLLKMLQIRGYPVVRKDFYYNLKTREKILEHDEVWQKICEELDWPFYETHT